MQASKPCTSSLDQLLWLVEFSDIAQAQARDVLKLVEAALDDCCEEDERYPYLLAIEEHLLQGSIPHGRLSSFALRFPRQQNVFPPDLESEFRSLADGLPEAVWCTSTYLELEAALDSFDDYGDELRLLDYLEFRSEKIQEVQEQYASQTVTSSEVTSESVVGHRLLSEGLVNWLEALRLAQTILQQGGISWNSALEAAERGNRLLIAVQKLHRRVAAQAPQAKLIEWKGAAV